MMMAVIIITDDGRDDDDDDFALSFWLFNLNYIHLLWHCLLLFVQRW